MHCKAQHADYCEGILPALGFTKRASISLYRSMKSTQRCSSFLARAISADTRAEMAQSHEDAGKGITGYKPANQEGLYWKQRHNWFLQSSTVVHTVNVKLFSVGAKVLLTGGKSKNSPLC